MQTISDKDFVISIVSNRYLKSRNCMYEMCELMRNRKFKEKLLFLVVDDKDENIVIQTIVLKMVKNRCTYIWSNKAGRLS